MEHVSIEKVQEFQANGAVKLENVFDPQWIDLVRKGVDVNLRSPSQFGESLKVLPLNSTFTFADCISSLLIMFSISF